LLPESEWTSPSEIVLDDKSEDPTDDAIESEDETEKLLHDNSNKEKQPTGKVVGIIKRKWRQYCGIIQPNILKGSGRHIFIPAEKKIPRVRIETRQAEKLYNQRIIVAIDQWPRHSRYPQGHFVRSLGPLGDKDTENEVLLIEHDVPHSKFSEEVLSFLPKLPWNITEQVSKF
jgi:exosome complex exonuclease DIS3/RRP44